MPKPGSSASSHRFAAPLPRPYEEPLPERDGEYGGSGELRSARHYQFSAQDIASGLLAVSKGASYATAGQEVRANAAQRWGVAGEGASRRHGTLVSDWVEVYAAALWRAQAPDQERWPEVVFVGVLPLTVGRSRVRPRLSFSVFVAMSTQPDGTAAVIDIATSTGTGVSHWAAFLRGMDGGRRGRPRQVIGDGSSSLARAVGAVWPTPQRQPTVWIDEQVMRADARRICAARGLDDRDRALWVLLQRAWRSRRDWELFADEARRYRVPELDRWLSRNEPVMDRQFSLRTRVPRRSRQPVRTVLAELERRLGTRRAAFGNQARTNRLLLLMALDLSGFGRMHAWAQLICDWLLRGNGNPETVQRRIADRRGNRSLRGTASVNRGRLSSWDPCQ
jgi:hypothetical protein